MKFLFTLLLAATSTVSFANSSMNTYSEALGPISLDNACITDAEVKSINPVKFCTKIQEVIVHNGGERGDERITKCIESELRDVVLPRAFERTVCLVYKQPRTDRENGECLKYGTKSDFLPASIKVFVTPDRGTGRVETFAFPACN